MTERGAKEAVRPALTSQVPIEEAFAVFSGELNSRWLPEYVCPKDALMVTAIEAGERGRCLERGSYGFECEFGRVLARNPPRRLAYSWQISPTQVPEPKPEKSSEIEVRFAPAGPATTNI